MFGCFMRRAALDAGSEVASRGRNGPLRNAVHRSGSRGSPPDKAWLQDGHGPPGAGPKRGSLTSWLREKNRLTRFRYPLLLALLLFPVLAPVAGTGHAETKHHIQAALVHAGVEGIGARTTEALAWFYAERGHAPAWDRGDRLPELLEALEDLARDGLDPERYRLSELRARVDAAGHGAAEIACTDLMATEAYLAALLDLALGRLDPDAIERIWQWGAQREGERLRVVMLAGGMLDDIEGAFDRARPSTRQYRGLRAGYARMLERARTEDWPWVPSGPLLREGDSDPRVPLLRERLQRAPDTDLPLPDNGNLLDAELAAAVVDFQHRHGLTPDGIVGPETLGALNVPAVQRLEQLRVNLERMRWLARKQPETGVVVDIAGARVAYRREGEVIWEARAQVGRPSRRTPRLKSEVTHLTFHPSWTVPPTILREDMLPRIREDIGYLERNRIRVLDHSGTELDPGEVDWDQPGGILLRQEPGPENPLGRLAIRFPNPFLVYLHDTPSKGIFERVRRQVSSGCVRVEHPVELARLLIEDGSDTDADQLKKILDDGETENFYLTRPIPILLAYWTADVAADGSLLFRPDTYGRDDRIARALAERALVERPLTARSPLQCMNAGAPS
ncbi:MAG: peptidoglycan-binding protein [Thioalkalivibrio sp.]|nr:MAG: peptidoglycan-binding protein [Thioalkalivibrio sp.]